MVVRSIDTEYKGHRFRSRLEARWAVVFDHLNIRWEYESQGFLVRDRLLILGDLGLPSPPWGYLPDFWFPDFGLWGEVKGEFDNDFLERRFLSAAADLSDGSCRGNESAHDVVLFGPLSNFVLNPVLPFRLHMHKGFLYAMPWDFSRPRTCSADFVLAYDGGQVLEDRHADILLRGYRISDDDDDKHQVYSTVYRAYLEGNKSRFEHNGSKRGLRRG